MYKLVMFILITVIVLLIAVSKKKEGINYPFRCASFSVYHFGDANNKKLTFSVTQVIRFQDQTKGYLLFSGHAEDAEGQWIVQRRVAFFRGAKIDSNTFKFHIDGISIAPEDNLPERYFTPLIREFSYDNIRMQIDVINIGKGAYLIGGPLSSLFSCVRY